MALERVLPLLSRALEIASGMTCIERKREQDQSLVLLSTRLGEEKRKERRFESSICRAFDRSDPGSSQQLVAGYMRPGQEYPVELVPGWLR